MAAIVSATRPIAPDFDLHLRVIVGRRLEVSAGKVPQQQRHEEGTSTAQELRQTPLLKLLLSSFRRGAVDEALSKSKERR